MDKDKIAEVQETFRPDSQPTVIALAGIGAFLVAPILFYWEFRYHPAIIGSTVCFTLLFFWTWFCHQSKTATFETDKFE